MSNGLATGACWFLVNYRLLSSHDKEPSCCCHHFQVEHIPGLSLEVAGFPESSSSKWGASQMALVLSFKGTDLRDKPENV